MVWLSAESNARRATNVDSQGKVGDLTDSSGEVSNTHLWGFHGEVKMRRSNTKKNMKNDNDKKRKGK